MCTFCNDIKFVFELGLLDKLPLYVIYCQKQLLTFKLNNYPSKVPAAKYANNR